MAAKEKTGNAFVETIKTIVYALLIAGVFRTLFFQPFPDRVLVIHNLILAYEHQMVICEEIQRSRVVRP